MFPRYFAVPDPLSPGALSLWRVNRRGNGFDPWGPMKTQWSGRPVDDVRVALETVYSAISAAPLEASIRFAEDQGRCLHCGERLTRTTSIAYGVGPDCLAKLDPTDRVRLTDLIAQARLARTGGAS